MSFNIQIYKMHSWPNPTTIKEVIQNIIGDNVWLRAFADVIGVAVCAPAVSFYVMQYSTASLVSFWCAYLFVAIGRMRIYGYRMYTSRITYWQILAFVMFNVPSVRVYFAYASLLTYMAMIVHGTYRADATCISLIIIWYVSVAHQNVDMLPLFVLYTITSYDESISRMSLMYLNIYGIVTAQNYIVALLLMSNTLIVLSFFFFETDLWSGICRRSLVWIAYMSFIVYVAAIYYDDVLSVMQHFGFICGTMRYYFCDEDEFRFIHWSRKVGLTVTEYMRKEDELIELTLWKRLFCHEEFVSVFLSDPQSLCSNTTVYVFFHEMREIGHMRFVCEKRDNVKIEYSFCPMRPASDALIPTAIYNRIVISDAGVIARFNNNSWDIIVPKKNVYTIDIYMLVWEMLQRYGVCDVRTNILKFIMMMNMRRGMLPNDE